jgi:ferredoxin
VPPYLPWSRRPGGPPISLKPDLLSRCIGCGIYENHCPLNGEAAIRVYAPTELGSVAS